MNPQELLNQYFTFRCRKGLYQRGLIKNQQYLDQLDYEIDIICKMGFAGYFLIVSDILEWCRDNDIPIGPGRGSGAGSLCCYSLRITELDPIRYGLIFERFLNPARVSMPDLDLDFCKEKRHLVIEHLVQKFGEDCVCGIGTFGTMKTKGAIRDVSRALGYEYEVGDKLAKMVLPAVAGKEQTLSVCYEKVPDLQDARIGRLGQEYKRTLHFAEKFEGRIRVFGSHASGFVISDFPILQKIALARNKDGTLPITQLDMREVEDVGLIKFDILGLQALTTIDRCLKMIEQRHGTKLDPLQFPVDDEETYNLLCAGDTLGVFQLGASQGIQGLTTQIQPRTLEDISMICAVYRPGPMASGMVDNIIAVRNKTKEPEYTVPELAPILEETAGVIVYQEQAMQICRDLAGYSLAESDVMRKAIGKKIDTLMAEQESKFIGGMTLAGFEKAKATKIYEDIKAFSDYSFNKAHSASYGYIGFITAYLKAHYPVEYMCSCLISESGKPEEVYRYISNCKYKGIKILPPDINESESTFSISKDNAIRFGLGAVKNVGDKAMRDVTSERRKKGPFTDIINFCERTGNSVVDRGTLQSLILAGAFDSIHVDRSATLEAVEDIWRYKQEMKSFEKKQDTFRKDMQKYLDREAEIKTGSSKKSLKRPKPPSLPRLPSIREFKAIQPLGELDILRKEQELLGYYVTGHPIELVNISEELPTIPEIKSHAKHNNKVKILAVPSLLKETTTRKTKEKMAYVTLEDGKDVIEAVIFAKSWARVKKDVQIGVPAIFYLSLDVVSGNVQDDDEENEEAIVRGRIGKVDRAEISARYKTKEIDISIQNIKPKFLLEEASQLKKLMKKGSTEIKLTVKLSSGAKILFEGTSDNPVLVQRIFTQS